nr:hypothetical protein [Curtobacterium sp. L6-1]
MTNRDAELQEFAAALSAYEIPRVGWPTSVLPPKGVRVRGSEHGSSVNIFVSSADGEAIARLDLETREVIVDATGDNEDILRLLQRLALRYVADRDDFDERRGVEVRPAPPEFLEDDPDTWSPLQLFAHITNSYWYPPGPSVPDLDGWLRFSVDTVRFNEWRVRRPDGARAQHPDPLQAERWFADPATPDQPAPAAE